MTVILRPPLLRVAICAGLATWMGSQAPAAAATIEGDRAMLRVRSSDGSIAALINQAFDHSPTFHKLIAIIDASNGIVYVEAGVCQGRVPACLAMWMQVGGTNRFMRIVLDRKRLHSSATFVGAIGHELQHATEVLSEPSITNGQQMYFFYRQYMPTARAQFETAAAIHAGDAVEDEIRRHEKRRDP